MFFASSSLETSVEVLLDCYILLSIRISQWSPFL